MMLLKCCTQYASNILSSSHMTRKGQFSSQFQRKAMPKNVQTTAQLHSFHTASKVMLKILQARLQQYINWELPDVQSGFRKGREIRDQIANICWIIEKTREFQKNIYFCFIEYSKAFDFLSESCSVMFFQSHGPMIPCQTPLSMEFSRQEYWSGVPLPSSKVIFKILQARLQQYMNQELPDVQAGFRKDRGSRDQIANVHWIIEKAREFQKNIYFCFIDYA